ncbi:hypothetical protein [Streptomyces sp. NBC_00989]|uniref:hypothetical protein n=1 Tax=Streptomyces sp. NBC_00989 TaxID=2903705 RepID=UPI002F906E80|nr:hypothetical protein OG714_54605 [Streptomyces sp. NBC_00989]
MSDTTARPVLLIDMGGVSFAYSFAQALAHWAAAAGTSTERLEAAWRIDAPFDAFERGEITPAAYLQHLRSLLGVDLSNAQLAEGWNAIYGQFNTTLTDLLRDPDLRSRFAAVVGVSNTNQLHAQVWPTLFGEHLKSFDDLVCSHTIGITKPEPGFFDHIAGEYHVGREDLVLVDDIPEVTARATELGLTAHTYTSVAALSDFLNSL